MGVEARNLDSESGPRLNWLELVVGAGSGCRLDALAVKGEGSDLDTEFRVAELVSVAGARLDFLGGTTGADGLGKDSLSGFERSGCG